MRKTFSLVLVVMLVMSMLMLSACSGDKVMVESVLEMDSNYVGHRVITVKYPLSTHIDALSEKLIQNYPLKDSDNATFEYLGVKQDGYTFVMDIAFESRDEYLKTVSALVGREVMSGMSRPDSVLTSGTRMLEDFDVSDLIKWMTVLSAENEETKSLLYDYSVNTVSIDNEVFNTGSTIDISKREGMPINSIVIETTNLKDGTYDRTITFSIPNKTYLDLAGSIEEYFSANTSKEASYSDFTSLGTSWEYKVIYKALSIEKLSEYTAMLLDTSKDEVFYGDKDNSSTPLSEGLVFEESFDTFSFINSDKESVALQYKYALPTKTTHGDGSLYDGGKWSTVGAWQDGVYSVGVDADTMNIRIPDGIQYSINGISMKLEVVDKNNFVRLTEFLYSKTQGIDGMLYAKNFFETKGVRVETDEDEDNLICRVICEGSDAQITDQLVKCFGSGNFMAYDVKERALSLSAKTQLSDYINLGYMLTSTNANRPITYTVKSSWKENIVDIRCDSAQPQKAKDSAQFTVDVNGGEGTVLYNGNIPNILNIIIYCIIGAIMFFATIAIIIYMLYKRRKTSADKQALLPTVSQQTTTFSITELTSLSDKLDKELRDEIDKDIDSKIEADRIVNLSKELKAQEIARLEKMIYGDENTDDTLSQEE